MPATQVERRRLLLKGLGKGSAVLAAAVPIKSLAVTSVTQDKHLCTVSGVQSGVRSNTTGLPTCGGKSVTYYTTAGTWPKNGGGVEVISNGAQTYFRSLATFRGLFGAGSLSTMATLFATVTDETHWVVALLNAQINGVNFPYSPAQVVGLYNNATQSAAALSFFKTHMELL